LAIRIIEKINGIGIISAVRICVYLFDRKERFVGIHPFGSGPVYYNENEIAVPQEVEERITGYPDFYS
jgi:hypothetical protein